MTSRAIDVISQARTTMDDGSDALDAYQRWFGPIDMQNSLIVLNVFRSIYQNLSSSSLQFQYNHSKNLYAYVYSGTSNLQVWLCKYFWSKAGNSGINSRGGILIHELAHYARQQIGDYQYGTQKSQKLAFDSDVAIYNADNYQFFAESL
ncbi:MAG: hypothetical protein HC845_13545 [Akkermansiaceae bacterium]|nr:hypothetical protein [Akkermansiaceae bacterium]